MDVQRALISKALSESALPVLVERGINKADFFPTPEHADAYRWMSEYYQQYGEAPTARAFKQNYPAYKLVRTKEPLDFLIDELRKQRMFGLVDDVLFQATEIRRDGAAPQEILALYAQAVSNVNSEIIELRDTDLTITWQQRLERYETLENMEGGMRGITLGFGALDHTTSGAQRGQLITVIGEPKAGKSTMLLRMAMAAHEHQNNVLFVGFEMTNEEQAERHDSMRAGISHDLLRTGQLRPTDKNRLKAALKAVSRKFPKAFVLSQDVESATTIGGLQAKVAQYTPDILYVDGVYMMDDEYGEEKGSSRHLTNMTRGLKRLAQTLDIPIVITTQVLTWKLKAVSRDDRTRRLTGDSIGYSSSFAQDSDLILGVENIPETDTEKNIRIVLSRNSGRVEITTSWDWDTGSFTQLGEERRTSASFDEKEDEDAWPADS